MRDRSIAGNLGWMTLCLVLALPLTKCGPPAKFTGKDSAITVELLEGGRALAEVEVTPNPVIAVKPERGLPQGWTVAGSDLFSVSGAEVTTIPGKSGFLVTKVRLQIAATEESSWSPFEDQVVVRYPEGEETRVVMFVVKQHGDRGFYSLFTIGFRIAMATGTLVICLILYYLEYVVVWPRNGRQETLLSVFGLLFGAACLGFFLLAMTDVFWIAVGVFNRGFD